MNVVACVFEGNQGSDLPLVREVVFIYIFGPSEAVSIDGARDKRDIKGNRIIT